MTPRTTPSARRNSVNRRVSIPRIPGTPSSSSQPSSERALDQWWGVVGTAGDHATDLDLPALEDRESIPVQGVRGGHAVVAQERVGEGQDLPTEGRIRQRLGVSDHAGREDDLADPSTGGAETGAIETKPVLEK